jgi:predicted RNA-binding protein YlqC (UPF0109 family)
MPKRISEIADSLRQLGDVQVSEWDFKALLNKDIKDLEIGPSLRKLGNRKVLDWDFKDALPTVHKLAHQEVDVVGWVKRAAHYKVLDWDFRSDEAAEPGTRRLPDPEAMQELVDGFKGFLRFVTASLIDEPERAEIRIHEIDPGVVRFKLVVTEKDRKTLLGRDASTATALRNVVKGIALEHGVHVLLQVLSHEEELAQSGGR